MLASGFSFKAIGELWAFEEHPVTGAIGKHTNEILASDPGFAPPCETIKVGPANWTHTNQFVRMVQHCAPCSDPDIPTKDGKIDKATIMADPKNAKMFSYINEGMLFNVIPYWVEEQYLICTSLEDTLRRSLSWILVWQLQPEVLWQS